MFVGAKGFDRIAWAGAMLFLAGTVALMGIITAEALYPGYNTADNMISDLGATEPPNSIIVQPSSNIFSASMALCGLLVIGATLLLHGRHRKWSVTLPYGSIRDRSARGGHLQRQLGHGACLVRHDHLHRRGHRGRHDLPHRPGSFPFRHRRTWGDISLVLFSYIFMGDNSPFMELGEGGLERWVAYPVLLWVLGLGGHLMGQRQAESKLKGDERSPSRWKVKK